MSDFLPKDYSTPQTESNYMRLEEGENVFRVLSSAITGWEWWEEKDNKRIPRRVKFQSDMKKEDRDYVDYQEVTTGKDVMKHFWAFVVWNYQAKKIQILEISQRTVMMGIEKYVKNEKWGDPKEYDLIISRTGEKMLTKYTVSVNPKEALDRSVLSMYKSKNINLEALYTGDDPFKSDKQTVDIKDIPENL